MSDYFLKNIRTNEVSLRLNKIKVQFDPFEKIKFKFNYAIHFNSMLLLIVNLTHLNVKEVNYRYFNFIPIENCLI